MIIKINPKPKPKGWIDFKYGECICCKTSAAKERHHIHYEDRDSLVPLCRECHVKITRINTKAGWTKKAPLTKTEREDLWFTFLDSFRMVKNAKP